MNATTNQAGNGQDLAVDDALQELMTDLFARFHTPGSAPPPDAVWATLIDVGLARLTTPESTGGSGAGWIEAAALLRTAATAGVAVPYAETDLLAGPLHQAAGIDTQPAGATTTVAVLDMSGLARNVPWAGATTTVTLVRSASAPGLYELAIVPTERLSITSTPGISATPLGTVSIPDSFEVTWSGVEASAVEAYVLCGALARAVQCVGAMEGMLISSIAHTTSRDQFGRALAKFQSVQNLVVDIAAETALARAAVDTALAEVVAHGFPGAYTQFRVAVARSVVSRALGVAIRNTHQVHGAIGTTHEHSLHWLTLPALQWRGEFGSAAFWESRLARIALDGGSETVWPIVVDGAHLEGVPEAWLRAVIGG
ncbi:MULTISPECIES: acyl-CoA dehydrogenase family protein [unclassified Rhodococcus (in: high G+C Gram-positive bacteria)]|uniref:acyl-CoA dehydrogenase family protein n=1 Tax=unclassified Rhodococcus (in: high G+C Gram-positive bacteria) TaxID=192944 RepID=UPI00339801B1